MPRGLPPTVNVAVTLSVTVSILDTVPEPSLEAYAIGAAAAGSDAAADNAAAIRIWKKRMAGLLLEAPVDRNGAGTNDRLCYTTCRNFPGPARKTCLIPPLAAGAGCGGSCRRRCW
jgi:hypothetical protein